MEYKLKLLGKPCYVETKSLILILFFCVLLSAITSNPVQTVLDYLLAMFVWTILYGYLVGFVKEKENKEN